MTVRPTEDIDVPGWNPTPAGSPDDPLREEVLRFFREATGERSALIFAGSDRAEVFGLAPGRYEVLLQTDWPYVPGSDGTALIGVRRVEGSWNPFDGPSERERYVVSSPPIAIGQVVVARGVRTLEARFALTEAQIAQLHQRPEPGRSR